MSASDPAIVPCVHCERPTHQRFLLCAEVKSHKPDDEGVLKPWRVSSQRWWTFCSDACRDAWYEVPTEEAYETIDESASKISALWPSDRYLRLATYHVAPGGAAELREERRFTAPHELNAYWRDGSEPKDAPR